ncbi:hypothetical protein [Halalkalibacter krulwichiae]|uniref:Uncharacterized protein n=1 Tax=Halalkalibacter krulwichiae TaxID=199441 RepID=A0A1X9MDL0_9BACI|nr:hypothetical protein [Halalkalibacter krulwichiae]ARK31517.1 hypothetical protein BkAM31D_17660 [Halalkalibacter krulwichiae]
MTRSLVKKESELYQDIEQPILLTYQTITASRYVTNRHLEQIVHETVTAVTNLKSDYPYLYYLTYMKGVFQYSTRLDNYQEFQRRFDYFYHSITVEIIRLTKNLQSKSYRLFLKRLLVLLIKQGNHANEPWGNLFIKLLPTIPAAHIDYLYQVLSENIDTSQCSSTVALAYSYLALIAGKEVTALRILQRNNKAFKEHDVVPHFELMKTRARYRTMKQWLSVLFPKKSSGQYGSLQKYVDEINSAIPLSLKEQESVWNRWLLSPNYQRFITYTRHLSEEQQLTIVERLLPELEQRLHQLEAAKTYEKLLLSYEKFEEASHYFLRHERDAHRLREEKEELLYALKASRPDLARPIYHQFIVRLVEKKSRAHYEQAALYMKDLQEVYVSLEDQELFHTFVSKLKKMYKTYRAFIEELKRIGL